MEITPMTKREKSKFLNIDSGKCSSDKDLVTFVDWVDDAPDIMINFIKKKGKPGRLNCYDSRSLREWLNNPSNTLARWVPKPGEKLDDSGRGGEPDPGKLYMKLYTGEYVEDGVETDSILQGKNNVFYNAYFWDIIRLGNLQGSFGASKTHGQAPGYRVYKLREANLLKPKKLSKDLPTIDQESPTIDHWRVLGRKDFVMEFVLDTKKFSRDRYDYLLKLLETDLESDYNDAKIIIHDVFPYISDLKLDRDNIIVREGHVIIDAGNVIDVDKEGIVDLESGFRFRLGNPIFGPLEAPAEAHSMNAFINKYGLHKLDIDVQYIPRVYPLD